MRGNFFVCACRVVIEGTDVGQFESVTITEDREKLGAQCTVLLPIYAIGFNSQDLPPASRIRAVLEGIQIMPGARIQVYAWYEPIPVLEQQFEHVLIFDGYIRQVISGFPSQLICEDHSFVLKFGRVAKDMQTVQTIEQMIEQLCPVSNAAFENFRKQQGFRNPTDFPHLSFDSTNSAESRFALKAFKEISPFDALQKLINLYRLFGYVTEEGLVYFGIGVRDKVKRTVTLNTRENVIDRDIVPRDGMFDNVYVQVNVLLPNGTIISREAGDKETGEPYKIFRNIDTEEGAQQLAENTRLSLLGVRNEGTITTLLYPYMRMYDYVDYTDTLFPELSSYFYVTGRTLKCDNKDGFIQTVKVTDERFVI